MFAGVGEALNDDYQRRSAAVEQRLAANPNPTNDKIALIWFHRCGGMAIEINQKVYYLYLGSRKTIKNLSAVIKEADADPSNAFYRLIFVGNAQNIARVEAQLYESLDIPVLTCSGCCVKLLGRCTDIRYSLWRSLVPSWISLYLLDCYRGQPQILAEVAHYPASDQRNENTLKGRASIHCSQLPTCLLLAFQYTLIFACIVTAFALCIIRNPSHSLSDAPRTV